uniref:Uncharacterized protein LOC111127403 n=1 Tax=Crassostrea virginica TaxID=6565 RepID=A0A8B8DKL3_CRAVI|nr:uncharacterized protein LOC111127403 [Crassostrea virginica]
MNSLRFLFFLPGLLLYNRVASLKCYECGYWKGNIAMYSCFDPLDTTHEDVRVTECTDQRHSCLKVKSVFEDGDVHYRRKCGKYKYKDTCKNLVHVNATTNYTLPMEICSCRTDLCNIAVPMPTSSTRTVLLAAVLWEFLGSVQT